jgi:hypothetical protein
MRSASAATSAEPSVPRSPASDSRRTVDLINIFQFDDDGKLTEEYVRTDYRSCLRQLGAEGT